MAEKKRGEAALSGTKKKAKKKKGKGRPVHEMRIKHAASGGFIARHSFRPQPGEAAPEDEEHAIPGMDQLHDHLDEHMSTPPAPPSVPSPSGGGMPGMGGM